MLQQVIHLSTLSPTIYLRFPHLVLDYCDGRMCFLSSYRLEIIIKLSRIGSQGPLNDYLYIANILLPVRRCYYQLLKHEVSKLPNCLATRMISLNLANHLYYYTIYFIFCKLFVTKFLFFALIYYLLPLIQQAFLL